MVAGNTELARERRWHRRAVRALEAGDVQSAGRAAQRLLDIAPQHADGNFIAAVWALEQGRPDEALSGFETATAGAPERADYWAQQARCLAGLGRPQAALAAVERALAAVPEDAISFDTIGAVLTRIGRYEEAAAQFARAIELQPGHPELLYHHANGLLFCGELERAQAVFEQVLLIDPDHVRSHLSLSELLSGPPPEGRIAALEVALARAAGDVDRELMLRQALARTLEAAGDTAAAFAHWSESKVPKKQAVGYTIEEDRRMFRGFERLFGTEAARDQRPGEPSRAPIFVVGMPRSGTTLVERILTSHPAVSSGGELSYLPQSVREAAGEISPNLFDPDSIEPALARDPAFIGARYLELSRMVVGDAERFIDKLPINFFLVGFIRRSMRNAKIVCLRRGALDTCLASFRQLFALGFRYYRYALSLSDTAEYYAMFDRLMAHWDSLFPGDIYRLQYESLVADTESEVRRLFVHLELDFDPAVLDFENNPTPVATASAAQVRQPVYQSSVGAWRRYEQELKPLRRHLEALGVDPLGTD